MNIGNFLKANIFVVLISNMGSVFNYLTMVVAGRWLSLEDFGTLNAVSSLGIVVSVWGAVLPFIVVKHMVRHERQPAVRAAFLRVVLKTTLGVCLLVGFGVAALASPIAAYLNLVSVGPVLLLAVLMPLGVAHSYWLGVMQGLYRYVGVSFNIFLASAGKLGFVAFAVILCGGGACAVLGAYALATMVGVVLAWLVTRRATAVPDGGEPGVLPAGLLKETVTFALPVGLMWLTYLVLTNVDIVLVKHFNSPEEAGIFSVAAVIGRIGLFIPGVLVGLLFAQVRGDIEGGRSSVPTVLVVMGITFAISGGFFLAVLSCPTLILTIFFGASAAPAAKLLVVVSGTMCLVSVLNVLFNYFVARHEYAFLWPTMIGISGMFIVIYLFMHDTPMRIAVAMLSSVLFILAACVATLLFGAPEGPGMVVRHLVSAVEGVLATARGRRG